MEVVGAYCIFERSNVRNVQYNEYYGDGDSKGYESVKNFYGINTVTKLECIGHVQKRVAGRLRQLKKTTNAMDHDRPLKMAQGAAGRISLDYSVPALSIEQLTVGMVQKRKETKRTFGEDLTYDEMCELEKLSERKDIAQYQVTLYNHIISLEINLGVVNGHFKSAIILA
ncbi:uncharacterized protein LOC101238613 [Trichonephila clavipes]|nr:uncharacterized protein LOC101238613 [Trichonephila clavipes]